MENIFDDIIISNPDYKSYNNPFYTVSLSKAAKKGWFISAVFGNYAWIVKRTVKHGNGFFKSRSVNIEFKCDREKAEKEITIIAEKKYLMYKELLKGME